jgi:hypothetical protein
MLGEVGDLEMYFRSILVWIALSLLAILNGILRNSFITPRIGELGGHVVSTVLLCALIILVTLLLIGWLNPKSKRDVMTIGLLWLLMTVAFEFLAGHYLFGHPWNRLFADYNFARGRVWALVLIATFVAPMLSARIRRLI